MQLIEMSPDTAILLKIQMNASEKQMFFTSECFCGLALKVCFPNE